MSIILERWQFCEMHIERARRLVNSHSVAMGGCLFCRGFDYTEDEAHEMLHSSSASKPRDY